MQSQNLKSYLYTISRRDIPISQQAIQAGHAAIEYAYLFGRPADHHPSYINLTVKDKNHLATLKFKLHANGICTSEFHEPYMEWGLTAIACNLTEDQRHLLSGLPLWRANKQGE